MSDTATSTVLRMAVGNVDGAVLSIRLLEVHDATIFGRPRVSYWVHVRELRKVGKDLAQVSRLKQHYSSLTEATSTFEQSILAVGLNGREVPVDGGP